VVSGGRKKDKDSKRRLKKADIGQPIDFRHVSHVGWDPNKGFDLDNVEDPQQRMFFRKVYIWECNEVPYFPIDNARVIYTKSSVNGKKRR
jgi:hypothetical protein